MDTLPSLTTAEETARLLNEQLEFQRRWQLISMSAYVTSTIGTLLCTSAASLLAAFSFNQSAAVLAALSTILIGIEKSLLFREKWKLHLMMHTKLKLLQVDISIRQLDPAIVGTRLAEILDSYATNLPVQARDP